MKKRLTIWGSLGAFILIVGAAAFFQRDKLKDILRPYYWEHTYIYPTDPAELAKLDLWQDQKFGVIFHYGLYSQRGEVESWRLCSEDQDWIGRPDSIPYDEYKRQYWGAIDSFAPMNLDPAAWADICKRAGMKYMVFTTKHHDGFCMWDTKTTDFSIAHGAFKDDPRHDIVRGVFDAFRADGFMIGCYLSKPDWHSQDFWWDHLATPNRNVNYSMRKHPERWERFKNYTQVQLAELTGGDYGNIDMLVLDGGWVNSDDIDLASIAEKARGHQPGMLIIDRLGDPRFENYRTPEREIMSHRIRIPWESMLTLADDWGWTPNDDYKSADSIVHQLVESVAKGGNLCLGVAITPDGVVAPEAVERLEKIGAWMDKNGEAIYGTRSTKRYNDGDTWFTRSKDDKLRYAIHLLKAGERPSTIVWRGNKPLSGSEIICLQTDKPVVWKRTWRGVELDLPSDLPANLPAVAFRLVM